MCRVYNQIGCLTALRKHFRRHRIDDFNSVKEVITFRDAFSATCTQLIREHEALLQAEQQYLQDELSILDTSLQERQQQIKQDCEQKRSRLQQQLRTYTSADTERSSRRWVDRSIRWYLKGRSVATQARSALRLWAAAVVTYSRRRSKDKRYRYLSEDFDRAVRKSCGKELRRLERKKAVVDAASTLIYGAQGEHRVVKELQHLSDDYHLINDVYLKFPKAIFNAQTGDAIQSIQIDHLLVAPSGIFLIETKNWSEQSLEDISLRSPVEQIRRTNFAIFHILNTAVSERKLGLDRHHWADKRIPLRNLIVFTKKKPKEVFQWVKIMTVEELTGYIQYFQPVFSATETQSIADYLLKVNEKGKLRLK